MQAGWPESLLIFGCGNMGGAMLDGWLAGGLDPARVTVVDPVLPVAPAGVTLLRELPKGDYDALLLGVKPQMLRDLAPSVAPLAKGGTVVLSILAGVEIASLAALFPDAGGHVRIMPNLSAAIGKSPIAVAATGIDVAGRERLMAFLAPLGTPEWIDEAQFDIVTALTGSGPAFVYRFISALASGAASLGLNADQAERLAKATVEGAALLATASPHEPGELADKVASPGGTTRAGLNVLDEASALNDLVTATLRAARDRGVEMSAESRA